LVQLKAGYLCYDFNDHPTAHLVEGLFHHHASSPRGAGLQVAAYSYGKDDNSTYRRNIEALARPFLDLAAAGHAESVERIRADGPHVVVDLQGHTLGARTEIAAMRVAPVQVRGCGRDLVPHPHGPGLMDASMTGRWRI
jgi:protein O-GlcNAc transferase